MVSEWQLLWLLQQLERVDKPMIQSETGFPLATGYRMGGDRLVGPESDNLRCGEVMRQFVNLIPPRECRYNDRVRALRLRE